MNKKEASAPEYAKDANNVQEKSSSPDRYYFYSTIQEGEKEYEEELTCTEPKKKLLDSCKLCHAPGSMIKKVDKPLLPPISNCDSCSCCSYEEYYCKICLGSIRIYKD